MDELFGIPLSKIDKKIAWLIVFVILFVVTPTLFTGALIFKHGSFTKGWEDINRQLSGINDDSPLALILSDKIENAKDFCKRADENGEIPIPQVEWKNSSDISDADNNHSIQGKIYSVVHLDCRISSDSDRQRSLPITLRTLFLAKQDHYTSDMAYRLEFYGDSGQKILERVVSGLKLGFTYTAGSHIPISLPVSTGRPISELPRRVVVTFLNSNPDMPSTRYVRTESISSPYKVGWYEIPSRKNVFNSFDSSGIVFRELSLDKGVTEYINSEAMMAMGSYNQKFKSSYSYLVYTEWEIQNTGSNSISDLTIDIEFLDGDGNLVDSMTTLGLWQSDHNLSLSPQMKYGFGKIWAFSDKATWDKVASYRIHLSRLRRR